MYYSNVDVSSRGLGVVMSCYITNQRALLAAYATQQDYPPLDSKVSAFICQFHQELIHEMKETTANI